MGRPTMPATPLDLDTRSILIWAASRRTGAPNISDFYREQKNIDLLMSRNCLYAAMRGEKVSQEIHDEIEQTILVRGWREEYEKDALEHLMRRSLALFNSHESHCKVCFTQCACCGRPGSEERRQALVKRKFPDPLEVTRDHPELKPDYTSI